MSNGLDATGFTRKRLNEIISDLNSEFKAVFGDNLNIAPESPDGQIIGTVGGSFSDLWEIAEGSYNAFNPSVASGAALSNLVQLNDITRNEATPSKVELTVTGTNGTLIPTGSLVSTIDGSVQFATDVDVTIAAGTGTVNATATIDGPSPAVAGTVTVINTPITGWDTVNNAADAILGTNEETDPELRARRKLSVTKAAKSISETILAEVLEVDGVTEAFIYNNDKAVVDPVTNTPANAFQVVVNGGVDLDIATAIDNERPIGIEAFGTTLVSLTDSQGISYDVGLTRPTVIDIYVIVNLTDTGTFPTDGVATIKQNIVDYANGDLITGRGFGVKDDVINSELYTPVNLVGGHTIDSILIGTAPVPTLENDIPIDFDEISSFVVANITVNVS